MCGATRCAVAYSSGAGAAEVYDGEVAAEQMRCKPERPEWRLCSGYGLPTKNVYYTVIGGCAPGIQKAGDLSAVRLAPLLGLEPRTP